MTTRHTESQLRMLHSIAEKKRRVEEHHRTALRGFELEISELESSYGGLYNTDAPVLSLPNEIAALIFKHAVDTARLEHFFARNKTTKEPWPEVAFSLVCRQWRSVAISLSDLWTEYTFCGGPHSQCSLDRFDAYLKRSSPRLLDLQFDFTQENTFVADLGFFELPMIRAAILHVDRWKRFAIKMPHYVLANVPQANLLRLFRDIHAPHLELFQMCGNSNTELERHHGYIASDFTSTLVPSIFESGAPRLTSVWLEPSILHNCCPPLDNVTTLHLTMSPKAQKKISFTWSAFASVLKLPNLINLSVNGDITTVDDFSDNYEDLTTYDMPQLKTLRLYRSRTMISMLPCLRAPQLDSLTLEEINFSAVEVESSDYFFPSLRSLSLVDLRYLNEEGARDQNFFLYQITRTLVDLTISQRAKGSEDNALLVMIAELPKGTWPNLRTATFNIEDQWKPDFYGEFAKSRLPAEVVVRVHENLVEHCCSFWEGQIYGGGMCCCSGFHWPDLEIIEDHDDAVIPRNWPLENKVALIRDTLYFDKPFHSEGYFSDSRYWVDDEWDSDSDESDEED
ncbi:unnamed protein product [Cyclocybe aegerita]|uniref:F-box domain-containing protein n=1 Tax=Cyclocybe aegerita TaxID=1973307 RepID=A0A8S0WFT8_CYCAE|nr:unnamed protein product [Cyclocybe aegerita]